MPLCSHQQKGDDTYHYCGDKIKQYVKRMLRTGMHYVGYNFGMIGSGTPLLHFHWALQNGGWSLGKRWRRDERSRRRMKYLCSHPSGTEKSGVECLVPRSTWITKPGHSTFLCTSLKWICGFHLLPFTSSQTVSLTSQRTSSPLRGVDG